VDRSPRYKAGSAWKIVRLQGVDTDDILNDKLFLVACDYPEGLTKKSFYISIQKWFSVLDMKSESMVC